MGVVAPLRSACYNTTAMGTLTTVEYILGLLASLTTLYMVYSLYFRKGCAERYVRTNPSAYLWRKLFGVEKTVALCKWLFAPLGTALAMFFIVGAVIQHTVGDVRYEVGTHKLPQVQLGEGLLAFEAMGFFQILTGLTMEEKVAYMTEQPLYDYVGDTYARSGLVDEPILLAFDSERVWWSDTERDVAMGTDTYVDVLHELGYISQGLLAPYEITEVWEGPEGPITVTVTSEEGEFVLHPDYRDDYVDMGILTDINTYIASTTYAYYMYEPFDQTALVLFLTEEEARALVDRGWRLAR